MMLESGLGGVDLGFLQGDLDVLFLQVQVQSLNPQKISTWLHPCFIKDITDMTMRH